MFDSRAKRIVSKVHVTIIEQSDLLVDPAFDRIHLIGSTYDIADRTAVAMTTESSTRARSTNARYYISDESGLVKARCKHGKAVVEVVTLLQEILGNRQRRKSGNLVNQEFSNLQ